MHFRIDKLMRSAVLRGLLQISIISFLMINSAKADVDNLYQLSLGSYWASFDSALAINSDSDSSVNFEDDLGLDRRVNAGWINGWYRVGDNHRVQMTYIPIKRSTFIQSNKDIVIDNTTIKGGAVIASDIDTTIFDFSYIYSLHRSSQLEIGLSTGLYWLHLNASFIAAGDIQAEGDDQPIFKSDYHTKQTLNAPMPLIGLNANIEMSPNWRARVSLRFLQIKISNIDGNITSTDIGAEYFLNENWGIGSSLSAFKVEFEVANIATNSALNWAHNGIQLYIVYKN